MPIFRFGMHFQVEDGVPPPRQPIHSALEALRFVQVEAPTKEGAEFYADQIREALEKAGN